MVLAHFATREHHLGLSMRVSSRLWHWCLGSGASSDGAASAGAAVAGIMGGPRSTRMHKLF